LLFGNSLLVVERRRSPRKTATMIKEFLGIADVSVCDGATHRVAG